MAQSSRSGRLGLYATIVAGLLAATGCTDNAGPSTATHLAFAVEPSSLAISDTMAPAVVVVVRDANERTVWSWSDTVELALTVGTGTAALHGTVRLVPVAGMAVFTDLSLDDVGTGYRLTATSGALEEAVSDPFVVHDVFTASTVAGGYSHTCALVGDGATYCWGRNAWGQLGDGTLDDRSMPTPVATALQFVSISAGYAHTCALTADGSGYCWGGNSYGQLGNGTSDSSLTPTQVAIGAPLATLEAGWQHTCGMTEGGTAYCWGSNWDGQLGDGTDTTRLTPTPVGGGVTFTSVDAGYMQTCGLATDGTAYCWGYDYAEALGDGPGTTDSVWLPQPVAGEHRFSAVVAGGGPCHGYSCGIGTDGVTYCWGTNSQAKPPLFHPEPTALDGDPGFSTIVPGGAAVCGLDASGTLRCWGDGFYGSIGVGTTARVNVPTSIMPHVSIQDVAGGGLHTCAVATDGTTYCWGTNDYGQLGRTTPGSPGWTTPVRVWKAVRR